MVWFAIIVFLNRYRNGPDLSFRLTVYPLRRRPARDDHVEVFDARIAARLVGQGMFHEVRVVALGEIGALVGASRFLAGQGAESHGLGGVKQEAQLQSGSQLRVEA